jgi:hypothetical protein
MTFGLKMPARQGDAMDTDRAWAQARELVRRGPPFLPSETTVLSAAFPLGLERPMQDGLDVLTIQVCAHFPRPESAAAPQGPTPLDAKIEETEAELETIRGRELEARALWQQLTDRARACAQRPAEWEAVQVELVGALEVHRTVDGEYLRVRSRLLSLLLARDRWRLDQAS